MCITFGVSESHRGSALVRSISVGGGQAVTLTADVGNGLLVFDSVQANGGEYDLEVKRVSEAEARTFIHSSVPISATDSHYVDYGAWDGFGSMTLRIDHSSDGAIDVTLVLDNQAPGSTYRLS